MKGKIIIIHSRKNVLATLKDELATRFHVAKIGVFGSVSRGEQTPESDIDIPCLSSPGRSKASTISRSRKSSANLTAGTAFEARPLRTL